EFPWEQDEDEDEDEEWGPLLPQAPPRLLFLRIHLLGELLELLDGGLPLLTLGAGAGDDVGAAALPADGVVPADLLAAGALEPGRVPRSRVLLLGARAGGCSSTRHRGRGLGGRGGATEGR